MIHILLVSPMSELGAENDMKSNLTMFQFHVPKSFGLGVQCNHCQQYKLIISCCINLGDMFTVGGCIVLFI